MFAKYTHVCTVMPIGQTDTVLHYVAGLVSGIMLQRSVVFLILYFFHFVVLLLATFLWVAMEESSVFVIPAFSKSNALFSTPWQKIP